MFCKNCGKEIQPGVQFCGSCGAEAPKIDAKPAAPKPVTEKPPMPKTIPNPVPVQNFSEPEQPKKSKLPILIAGIGTGAVLAAAAVVALILFLPKDEKPTSSIGTGTVISSAVSSETAEASSTVSTEAFDFADYDVPEYAQNSTGFILSKYHTEFLEKSDLEGLSLRGLEMAEAEICARNGKVFEDDPVMQAYFDAKEWYDSNSLYRFAKMNVYDRYNVEFIRAHYDYMQRTGKLDPDLLSANPNPPKEESSKTESAASQTPTESSQKPEETESKSSSQVEEIHPKLTTSSGQYVVPNGSANPKFDSINASSHREREGSYTYGEANLLIDDDTCWCEGVSGDGLQQSVTLVSGSTQKVRGIVIRNGYSRDADVYAKNGRIRDLGITFSDGRSITVTLKDERTLQQIDFGTTVDTSTIKLSIKSVYSGTTWDDTCVSYLVAY